MPAATPASNADPRRYSDLLQMGYTADLVAVLRGEIDPVIVARNELAARGLGPDGKWLGFAAAAIAHGLPR